MQLQLIASFSQYETGQSAGRVAGGCSVHCSLFSQLSGPALSAGCTSVCFEMQGVSDDISVKWLEIFTREESV